MARRRTISKTELASDLPLTSVAGSRFHNREPLPQRSILWLLLPAGFLFTFFYGAARQLVPDEAFYWLISRHLAGGYLDHPPGIAFLIRAGTSVLGINELGVRCGAAVLAFGSVLVLLAVCRRMLRDDRALLFLGVMWLCSPLLAALGTLATPDTPSTFFSVVAMATVILIAETQKREPSGSAAGRFPLWIAFGIATGLALLSKYPAILPAGAVALAVITTPSLRRELRTPGPWLAILAAAAVFSPVIYWNAHHDWASFKFQLHHGLSDQDAETTIVGGVSHRIQSFGEYVGGQFLIWTPVLMVIGLIVVISAWRKYRSLDASRRILVWSATVPLIFFGVAVLKSGSAGEINWPAFAYFPMSLLIVDALHEDWKGIGVKWVRIGIIVALVGNVLVHSPELLFKVPQTHKAFAKLNEFFGWKEMAHWVANNAESQTLVAARHQDAGEISFYLVPDHPDVWCYPAYDATGKLVSRPTSFDYMPDRPDLSKLDNVTFIGRPVGRGGAPSHAQAFGKTYGFNAESEHRWSKPVHGDVRHREIVNFVRGTPPIDIPILLPPTKTTSGNTNPARSTTRRTDKSAGHP